MFSDVFKLVCFDGADGNMTWTFYCLFTYLITSKCNFNLSLLFITQLYCLNIHAPTNRCTHTVMLTF